MSLAMSQVREVIAQKSLKLGLSARDAIERRADMGRDELIAYANSSRPVVLTETAKDWPLCKLTMDDLRDEIGDLMVTPRVGDYISVAFSADRKYEQMRLRDFLDLASRTDPNSTCPPYVGNHDVPEALRGRLVIPPYYPPEAFTEPRMWIGPANTVTPLHSDLADNLFLQLLGRKRFTVFPPHDETNLYTWSPTDTLTGSRFDPDNPDFEKFPLSRNAHPVICDIGPGELLFLPGMWFHHVRALELSVSINFFVGNLRPMAAFPPGTKLWDD